MKTAVPIKRVSRIFYTAARQLVFDDVLTLSAGLAFYVMLGLAPIVLLSMSVLGLMGQDAHEILYRESQQLLGPSAADVIRIVLENAGENRSAGWTSVLVSFVTFVISASGILAHLQHSLNVIWKVESSPQTSNWLWLRKRLLAMVMVPAVLLLLLFSVVSSTSASFLLSGRGLLVHVVPYGISFLVYATLFGLSFKILPDVRIAWRDVFVGSTVTAALFELGRFAIAQYFSRFAIGSAYGAAGSLVAMLIWVYYSATIYFYGAEVTQAWVSEFGAGFRPRRFTMKPRQPPRPHGEDADS